MAITKLLFFFRMRQLRKWIQNSSTHSQPSSMASDHPKSLSHTHPAFQTQGSTKIPIYVGNRSQRTPSVERRGKKSLKSHSRETSQEPSPTSQDPKSDQRSPEDDSSLFSISGMTSDNEYESNISESSGEASKPTQRDIKGYKLLECFDFCPIILIDARWNFVLLFVVMSASPFAVTIRHKSTQFTIHNHRHSFPNY